MVVPGIGNIRFTKYVIFVDITSFEIEYAILDMIYHASNL